MFDLDRLAAFERGLVGDRTVMAEVPSGPQMSRRCPATAQPVVARRGCPFAHSDEVAA